MSDKAQKVAEIFLDFLNAIESASISCKRQLAEVFTGVESGQTSEQAFSTLKFQEHRGEKLNEFGTSERANNDEKAWMDAFNLLKTAGATINKRFHGPNFIYAYWLYNERIFRQKLKNP